MKSNDLRYYIRKEIEAALNELKSPEEVAADKAGVTAAQAKLKAAQAELKRAQEKAAQKETTIKLKSLLEQDEESTEETPTEDEASEEEANPFTAAGEGDAAAGDEGSAEGGDTEASEEGGEEEKEKDKVEKANTPEIEDITLDFDISKVKKYNPDKRFLGTQGVVKKVTKDGMFLNVIPDNVEVFVNFSDLQ